MRPWLNENYAEAQIRYICEPSFGQRERERKKLDVVGHFDTPSSSQQPLTSYCLGNKQTHSTVLHSSAAGQRLIRSFIAHNRDGVENSTFVETVFFFFFLRICPRGRVLCILLNLPCRTYPRSLPKELSKTTTPRAASLKCG